MEIVQHPDQGSHGNRVAENERKSRPALLFGLEQRDQLWRSGLESWRGTSPEAVSPTLSTLILPEVSRTATRTSLTSKMPWRRRFESRSAWLTVSRRRLASTILPS